MTGTRRTHRWLRHPADRRSVGLACLHLGLLAVAAAAASHLGWAATLAIPVLACSSFGQLISTHNAMHSPVFTTRRMNRAWQLVLSICIGYPVSVFVPVHNLSHHLGLQTPRDILRTTEVRHRSNLLNLLHHMIAGTVHLHLLHGAYLITMRRSRPRWFAQVCCEAAAVIAFYALIAIAIGPLSMLVVIYVPAVIGQLLIVGFGYVQHDGCDPESAHDHSRNFLSPAFNWFIYDNGYHTTHHDRPAVHWSRAKEAHARDVVPHMHPGLDEPSLTRYLWRAFVSPGRRLRFDGTPVALPPKLTRRELWTPASAITSGASSGAVDG